LTTVGRGAYIVVVAAQCPAIVETIFQIWRKTMASKNLFKSQSNSNSVKVVKASDTVNQAGGQAYRMSDKAALAQYAMTGCFNGTYYASDKDQLKKVMELASKVSPEFLAKLAVYSRQKGLMKDMPAVLAAVVASRQPELLGKIFPKVVDNPKMLRNFVQVIRSNVAGRKSFGTRPKKLIQKYLESLTDEQLFKADVGNDPSLQDIIKLVHPKPSNKNRNAMYAYLLDKEYNKGDLCELARQFEAFKKDMKGEIPDVPFQMLTALPLTSDHWKKIAEHATWTQIRMNLNTFARHGVFEDSKMVSSLADKLADPAQVRRAKVFPYQLFTSFKNIDATVPTKLNIALQKAAEVACENIPEINGKVYVMVDVSGSMGLPVTGYRAGGVSSKMRCVDVAALVAAAILRKNPEAEVIPFDTSVHAAKMNPMDSIMTNAAYLAKFGGGGTNCSLPLEALNSRNAKGDLVIYVSDNESWVDSGRYNSTATMAAWQKFKARNPKAKLVCIDIQPGMTTQAHDRPDILNVGGFSDQVFDVIARFLELGNDKELWVKTIEEVQL
jgi:60 kDa SS-A/Ro ribonucleoprotein